MTEFINTISTLNLKLNNFLWDKLGLVLLIFSGIYFTCTLRFFQIKYFFYWLTLPFKKTKSRKENKTSITRFQALCTTLASTIGVGSIAGVASAIYVGGSGAVLWMWFAAFISMMTAYAENLLGIYFREKDQKGQWLGGTMYIIKNGFGNKFKLLKETSGVLFVIFCVLASFGIGNLGQINKITESILYSFPMDFLSFKTVFGIPVYNLIIGITLTVLCGFVITGGLTRIAKLTEKLIPFMVIFFVIGSLAVIITFKHNIYSSILSIFRNAFNFRSVTGATVGIMFKNTVITGFKRGLFSTEAGMGSTVLINISSDVQEPAEQGMWSIFQVFVDTFVVCTLCALVILCTDTHNISYLNDTIMVAHAFSTLFGDFGHKFVSISIFLFAFSSVIGWSQYALQALKFFRCPYLENLYKFLFIAIIPFGALVNSEFTWNICDTFNALMMIPNLIAILCLSPIVYKITENYIERKFLNKHVTPILTYKKGESVIKK